MFEDIDKHINCQSKTYNINILKFKNKTYEFYITQWEMMIQNYYKKINAVKTIFKDN